MAPIALRISNKKAYVWDVDDIATLRSHHRICGVLTGTLPHLSQQNVFLGVPLLLMPEEVVLLVDKGQIHIVFHLPSQTNSDFRFRPARPPTGSSPGLAILVDDRHAHHDPSTVELGRWDAERRRDVEQQLALAEQHDAREALNPDRAMSEGAILKRKEREARKARGTSGRAESSHVSNERPGPSTSPTTELVPGPVDHPDSEPVRAAVSHGGRSDATVPRNSTASYTVWVPGSSTPFEWYAQSDHSYTTLAAARDVGLWDYPETPLQRARCGVFRDLWEQRYFMGGGIKFGGEFLVYPGDPLRYHSHFVASVIESPSAPLRPMEIVAHGRLGTGTKKAHMLCEWDEDKKAVTYYSIEWAGFG